MDASARALTSFLIYMGGVFLLAIASHRLLARKSFLKEYFLGSRGLGIWALAMSYAATSASGGSFMGFPALIYQHGWILALWIASYMVVPLTCMGILGKRLNQVARKSGAITIPDVFRDRFGSTFLGVAASLILSVLLVFYLVAQFKAGAVIVEWLLRDLTVFQSLSASVAELSGSVLAVPLEDGDYYVALFILATAVIVYTAYGGFRAVVWTDVLQGIVMFAGVLLLLGYTLSKLEGGLPGVTRALESMRPIGVTFENAAGTKLRVPAGAVITVRRDAETWTVETTLPAELADGTSTARAPARVSRGRTTGLPPDLAASAETRLEGELAESVHVRALRTTPSHDLVSGPGFHTTQPGGFLPWGLAISFFVMWAISGAGQPTTMVRLMAFRDTRVYRRAMFSVCLYYTMIYIPLIVIFVCGRTLVPHLDDPDHAMPAIVRQVVPGFVAGIILAAPFAAVMSSVDSFLLAISSSLVRDIYQRTIRPDASEKTIRRLSYAATVVVGLIAFAGALNPPRFLQYVVIFASSGLASSFLAPMFFSLYWPRMTRAGAAAGMLGGFGACLGLYAVGWTHGSVAGYYLAGLHPVVWGIGSSIVLCLAAAFAERPAADLVERYFGAPASEQDGGAAT